MTFIGGNNKPERHLTMLFDKMPDEKTKRQLEERARERMKILYSETFEINPEDLDRVGEIINDKIRYNAIFKILL